MARGHTQLPLGLALGLGLGLLLITADGSAYADDYRQALAHLVADHPRIAAAHADQQGAESSSSRARSAWFPDLSLTTSLGHQRMTYTNGTPYTDLQTRELTFGLRATLWDFGATNAAIDKADLAVQQSNASADQVSQDLLLEGLTAYINLDRAQRSLDFAGQSVSNIQKQTGMEESRVEMGGGFTSDVLQAKSQLAGAEARLARAKGLLANARNRFRAVFGRDPTDDDPVQKIPVPFDLLPPSLPSAIAFAQKHNPQLEVLRLTAESSRAEIDRVRSSELYPNIHAVAQRKLERNPDGVTGNRTQEILKVEMTYQFNTGLGSFYAIDAAEKAAISADDHLAELRDVIQEQVSNAWQNLDSARENAGHLDNQVRIVTEFLRLAREERLQGRRSLIDVLSGETSLIDAQSDAASADADVAVAAFTLFRTTGMLDLSIIH
jgi:adhesin transport system outer membrane protein